MSNIDEFKFVEKMFNECTKHKEKYGFRDKLEHTKRVYAWANRLLEHEKADKKVVLTSAIFHDVGYTCSEEEHTKYSAQICNNYLHNNGYDNDFISKVTGIVANHGNKELLFKTGTSMEQILLIEADCLDESGALSVLRDALSEGELGETSYQKTYERLCQRSIMKKDKSFYCVTNTARKFWIEKKELYMKFMDSLRRDLDSFDDLY